MNNLRNIKSVNWLNSDFERLVITIVDNEGEQYTITRKPRRHTKEIRALQKQNIYCFEIQGVLYWYKESYNGLFVKYKEPENFRAEERTTNKVVKSYKTKERKSSLELPKVKIEQKKEVKTITEQTEVKHKNYDMIKTCIENDIPVYLCGEAGTGKNYTLERISWDLGLEFYFTNSVQQEYKLTGFIDAGGTYHETEFYKAFKNGGLFFLDEIDASIPEVLVLLNAAIANRYFEFPNGRIEAHKDFRVVAAGNTVGSGADEMYTGRMVLDSATLDRFAIIDFDYDRNVELSISNNNKELVDFVEEIRKVSKENGIRATFSYRCIEMVTKLEKANMDIVNILKIAVFKGLDKDAINMFDVYDLKANKYSEALKNIQGI